MTSAARGDTAGRAGEGASIVIVEHQPEFSLVLDYYLASLGYRVELIDRGDAAERRLDVGFPDLVVLEWASPGVSGIELLRRLRRSPAGRRLPVLLLATGRESSDAVDAVARGADDVVTQPFSLADMALRIAALLREPLPSARSDDEGLPLNPVAQRLFGMFAANGGLILDRRRIHQSLWGYDVSFNGHTVDIHIDRLRRLLRSRWRRDPITCLGEAGYRFDAP